MKISYLAAAALCAAFALPPSVVLASLATDHPSATDNPGSTQKQPSAPSAAADDDTSTSASAPTDPAAVKAAYGMRADQSDASTSASDPSTTNPNTTESSAATAS